MMSRGMGALGGVTGARPGDHICWAYSTAGEHRRVLTEYLQEGLEAGDQVGYFGWDGSQATVRGYLENRGLDTGRLITGGALVLGDARDAYTPDGTFEADARIAGYRALSEQAVRDGFRSFRVAAEAAWLFEVPGVRQRWPSYELRADLLAAQLGFTAMCCYSTRLVDRASLDITAAMHASTLDVESMHLFRIHGVPAGGIAIAGEIDASCAEDARELLLSAAPDVATPVVDLSGLRFVDVAGARAIAALVSALAPKGEPVEIAGASAAFRRVWDILRLDTGAPALLS